MSRLRAPLRQRSEASSFLVQSPARVSPRSARANESATSLDLLSPACAATPVAAAEVFVSPHTVLAALSTSEWLGGPCATSAACAAAVLTSEAGGWLRVRDACTGAVRSQRSLRNRTDATALCWGAGGRVFAGRRDGGLTALRFGPGGGLTEEADGALHDAPILALTLLSHSHSHSHNHSHNSGSGSGSGHSSAMVSLVSLDARGGIALWDALGPLRCVATARAAHPPGRCLAASANVPNALFVPGGVAVAQGAAAGPLDIAMVALCAPRGGQCEWETQSVYRGATAPVLCVALAPRDGPSGSCGECDGAAVALWAGTAAGALHVWDVRTAAALRTVPAATPSRAPVHHVAAAGIAEPRYLWVCTRGGAVALWDAQRLAQVCELPIAYPRGAPDAETLRHLHASREEAGEVDCVSAARHFTLFAGAIEPIWTVRFWTAATDGTVRSWLCQVSAADSPLSLPFTHTTLPATTIASTSSLITSTAPARRAAAAERIVCGGGAGPPIDRGAVRAFLAAKASLVADERAELREAVAALTRDAADLHARNRVLAEALRHAVARLNAAGDDDDNNNNKNGSGSGSGSGAFVEGQKENIGRDGMAAARPGQRGGTIGKTRSDASTQCCLQSRASSEEEKEKEKEKEEQRQEQRRQEQKYNEELQRLRCALEEKSRECQEVRAAQEEAAAQERRSEQMAQWRREEHIVSLRALLAQCRHRLGHVHSDRERLLNDCEALELRAVVEDEGHRPLPAPAENPSPSSPPRHCPNCPNCPNCHRHRHRRRLALPRLGATVRSLRRQLSATRVKLRVAMRQQAHELNRQQAAEEQLAALASDIAQSRTAAAHAPRYDTHAVGHGGDRGTACACEAVGHTLDCSAARQRLLEREATLLCHAERLCALEEELRHKERKLMARRRDGHA